MRDVLDDQIATLRRQEAARRAMARAAHPAGTGRAPDRYCGTAAGIVVALAASAPVWAVIGWAAWRALR